MKRQAIPYGAGLIAAIDIPKAIGAPQDKAVWIAASYPYESLRLLSSNAKC